MYKRLVIVNFSFAMAVLFSILFQSFHAFEHLEHQLTEKKCRHSYGATHTEITHEHHGSDHCFVCDFTFSSGITTADFGFALFSPRWQTPYSFTTPYIFRTFSGNAAFLREPPSFVD